MAPLRYRLLLLDHDDTTVASTETIHYPAHIESIRQLRPDLQPCTLEQWFEANLDPGISAYLDSLFDAEQMKQEHAIWTSAMEKQRATFYAGMPEVLANFRRRGGKVAVISHSQGDNIKRDYSSHPRADDIMPERVYGWEFGAGKRKPSPWPALQAMHELQVSPEQTIMLDDLKPGVEMAIAAGVTAIGAGWGHSIPSIQDYMRSHCVEYFERVADFAAFLLGEQELQPEPDNGIARL